MQSKPPPSKPRNDDENVRWSITMPGVTEAAQRAVRHAIALHHFEGRDVHIMRNGKIVRLTPDGRELPLEEDENADVGGSKQP